jgi:peptidoglycan-N-acetylglucosamine deacetylase
MRRGWHWDFEDEGRARRPPAPPATPGPPPAPAPPGDAPGLAAWQMRRRRLGAAVGVALIIAVIVAVLSASGSHRRTATPSADAHGARSLGAAAATAPAAPTDPPDDRKAVASVLAYTPFVKDGGGSAHDVALTFDDGPGPYTPALLDVLERYHVQATFFAIGVMERYFSASTVRELHDGDVVGDHTETHPELALLPAREQREELYEQIARVELLGGPRPDLFRPPYGSYNATTMRELRRLHLLMVLWSVDTGDYLRPGVGVIVERALAGAHPGAIILMHDGGGDRTQTIAALPEIITKLRLRGYRLVTVPQLLAKDPPPAGQPLPANLGGD